MVQPLHLSLEGAENQNGHTGLCEEIFASVYDCRGSPYSLLGRLTCHLRQLMLGVPVDRPWCVCISHDCFFKALDFAEHQACFFL